MGTKELCLEQRFLLVLSCPIVFFSGKLQWPKKSREERLRTYRNKILGYSNLSNDGISKQSVKRTWNGYRRIKHCLLKKAFWPIANVASTVVLYIYIYREKAMAYMKIHFWFPKAAFWDAVLDCQPTNSQNMVIE